METEEDQLQHIASNPGSVSLHLFAALMAWGILEILKFLREIAKK